MQAAMAAGQEGQLKLAMGRRETGGSRERASTTTKAGVVAMASNVVLLTPAQGVEETTRQRGVEETTRQRGV